MFSPSAKDHAVADLDRDGAKRIRVRLYDRPSSGCGPHDAAGSDGRVESQHASVRVQHQNRYRVPQAEGVNAVTGLEPKGGVGCELRQGTKAQGAG